MAEDELLNIFEEDRTKLSSFLQKDFRYNYLKDLLLQIEKDKGSPYIKKLFLGRVGLEHNKQQAIYELPTMELILTIKYICEYLNIKEIEEIAAGMGLLSAMLKFQLGDNYNVNATDGKRWIETSMSNKYYPMTVKLFLNYCLDQSINFDDKLVIISWLPLNDITDFLNLIKDKRPKNLIIIGNMTDQDLYSLLIQKLNNHNYKKVGIPVKQICYKDNFYNDYSRSSMLFASNDPDFNMENFLLNLKLNCEPCLKQKQNYNDKEVIADIIVEKFHAYPFLIEKLYKGETEFKDLVTSLCYCIKKKIKIPEYLKDFSDYQFWFDRIKDLKMPLHIKDYEKFSRYKKVINELNNENGLEDLKNKNILPNWINDRTNADQFLWLDYSTENKKWKSGYQNFRLEFGIVYSQYR